MELPEYATYALENTAKRVSKLEASPTKFLILTIISKFLNKGDIPPAKELAELSELCKKFEVKDHEIQVNVEALYLVGYCCLEGIGIEQNVKIAKHIFRKIIFERHPLASYHLGTIYMHRLNSSKESQDSVNIESCFKLKDKWDAWMQHEIGLCYFDGVTVPMDKEKAIAYMTLAAGQRYLPAQKMLAHCYENGDGVAVDLIKSFQCTHAAAISGDVLFQCELARLYIKGVIVNNVTYFKDAKKGANWYMRAANNNNNTALAKFNLGWCYETGTGVPKNLKNAAFYYQAAIQEPAPLKNAVISCYRLACYFKNGIDASGTKIEKDLIFAFELFLVAAKARHIPALYETALCYFNGWGTAKDKNEAGKYFKMLTPVNYAESKKYLALCGDVVKAVAEENIAVAQADSKIKTEQNHTKTAADFRIPLQNITNAAVAAVNVNSVSAGFRSFTPLRRKTQVGAKCVKAAQTAVVTMGENERSTLSGVACSI